MGHAYADLIVPLFNCDRGEHLRADSACFGGVVSATIGAAIRVICGILGQAELPRVQVVAAVRFAMLDLRAVPRKLVLA